MTPTPIKPGQVAGPYATPCIQAARQAGVADATLAEAVGRPVSWLHNPPPAIDTLDYLCLMACGARHDPNFGLRVGQSVAPGSFPVLGYTIMSCSNLGQVIEQVIEFESLNHDLGRSRLVREGSNARLEWHPNPAYLPDAQSDIYRQVVDSVLAGFVAFAPWLLTRKPAARRVDLACPQPRDPGGHEAILGSPVAFNQAVNGITTNRDLLDWPVETADPTLFNTLQEHAAQLLAMQQTRAHFTTADHLRRQLIQSLPRQELRLAAMADKLNMSPRSLQRHLQRENTHYQEVVDELRLSLARSYLQQSTFSLGQIATALGFREQSSFNHWFRSMNGVSPGECRKGWGNDMDMHHSQSPSTERDGGYPD